MMAGVSEHASQRSEPGETQADPAGPKIRVLSLIAVAVLALDIVTKVVAVAQLEDRAPVEILGGLVYLQLVRNPGAAFSLATGYTWVLTIVAIAVVVVIIRVARRLRSTGWAVALGLVLGGALGNLADRIFRTPGPLQGHVADTRRLPVPEGLDGMRVDAGLARLLGLSRTVVAELAEGGRVEVDGRAAGKSDRLAAGGWLEV